MLSKLWLSLPLASVEQMTKKDKPLCIDRWQQSNIALVSCKPPALSYSLVNFEQSMGMMGLRSARLLYRVPMWKHLAMLASPMQPSPSATWHDRAVCKSRQWEHHFNTLSESYLAPLIQKGWKGAWSLLSHLKCNHTYVVLLHMSEMVVAFTQHGKRIDSSL